ncbi:ubiquinol oxidase subunit II [Brevundimonas sp.]|uniref:ubiquinol oxidase subunit II n=1 Tax=Brevundimonas sp. TaxID=1871086 RepID=UPI00260F0547|nr:ubiquinol oxidase subunit II [Brevundimonas sp.]
MRPHAFILCLVGLLLSGCQAVVLDPAGHVAAQQRDLLVISVVLMLIIIVPVMTLTIWFAWKYRASNTTEKYDPEWDHSTHLELVIWAAPLLIIICLGAVTWTGTHLLDPYRPLDKIDHDRPVPADVRPLEVQVVALDWKWLFIYPEYGVASVNELAAPVDRPIRFSLTSSSVMNSFYIPALAGQIYAMPGMETKLHGVINAAGDYKGFSANYSGDGFSGMKFTFKGLDPAAFDAWLAAARQGGGRLDRRSYLELARPTENAPVQRFAAVEPLLWDAIVNMCVQPGKMCMGEMMAIDARGGLDLDGARNTLPLVNDQYARRGSSVFGGAGEAYVMALCTPEEAAAAALARERLSHEALFATPRPPERLQGAGLTRRTPFIPQSPVLMASLETAP